MSRDAKAARSRSERREQVRFLPTALVASLSLLPPLATTSLLQDAWLGVAYLEWQETEPWSYWLSRLPLLVLAVWLWRRMRRA